MKKLLLVFLISIISGITYFFLPAKENTTVLESELPAVDTADNFERIIKGMMEKQRNGYGFGNKAAVETTANEEENRASADAGGDYSTTNVQVSGVDEADRIKTDGSYIYQLRDTALTITKAYPATEMKVVYEQLFTNQDFYPHEMFVDEQHLVLIGAQYRYEKEVDHPKDFTKVLVYQLNERSNLSLIREAEIEGYYLSSRKINNDVYIITNSYLPLHILDFSGSAAKITEQINLMKPIFRDSAISAETQFIEWEDVRYFPNTNESSYLFVANLNLTSLQEPIVVNSYLGAGRNVYASFEHLYVTSVADEQQTSTMRMAIFNPFANLNTSIYKFKLDQQLSFIAEGKVEGGLLNQFSMDEHEGYFRIATTKGDMWSEENPSENLLFILNENLEEVGSITGIAEGERIYSARFVGDRGYIVTFKQVDPLFVLDLKDPKNPKVLGELKIPGFSDYLHPYDENHLIGFGRDTTLTGDGLVQMGGFKMALFDITDVHNPKEKFVEIIGGNTTYSELLHNHKALLFSKEKNLIAFPIETYSFEQEGDHFQGAYVYGLDLETGFQLKKQLSHVEEAQQSEWDYQKFISRLLYIGDTLYALSNFKIDSYDLTGFQKKAEVIFNSR